MPSDLYSWFYLNSLSIYICSFYFLLLLLQVDLSFYHKFCELVSIQAHTIFPFYTTCC